MIKRNPINTKRMPIFLIMSENPVRSLVGVLACGVRYLFVMILLFGSCSMFVGCCINLLTYKRINPH
jgi:hypothetical protein